MYSLFKQMTFSGSYFSLNSHYLLTWKSINIVRRISVMVTNLFWACLCSSSNWFWRFRTCWLDSSFKVTCWEQSLSVVIMMISLLLLLTTTIINNNNISVQWGTQLYKVVFGWVFKWWSSFSKAEWCILQSLLKSNYYWPQNPICLLPHWAAFGDIQWMFPSLSEQH